MTGAKAVKELLSFYVNDTVICQEPASHLLSRTQKRSTERTPEQTLMKASLQGSGKQSARGSGTSPLSLLVEDGCRQVAQTLFPSVPPQRPLSWRELAFGFTQRRRRLPAPVGPLWENRLQQTTTAVVEREKRQKGQI